MKAYWISVAALVIISAVAGAVLQYSNPTSAQATLSKHDATRL